MFENRRQAFTFFGLIFLVGALIFYIAPKFFDSPLVQFEKINDQIKAKVNKEAERFSNRMKTADDKVDNVANKVRKR